MRNIKPSTYWSGVTATWKTRVVSVARIISPYGAASRCERTPSLFCKEFEPFVDLFKLSTLRVTLKLLADDNELEPVVTKPVATEPVVTAARTSKLARSVFMTELRSFWRYGGVLFFRIVQQFNILYIILFSA